jgi:nucleoid DNA-binding protein
MRRNLHQLWGNEMNKADLVARMADQSGISKADAAKALDAALDGIVDALKGGDKVTLVNFGTFSAKNRAARTGKDPRGNTIQVPARTVAHFKPGKQLSDALN